MRPPSLTAVCCLALALVAGCREDRCRGEAPAFQLDVATGPVPGQAIARLELHLTAAGVTRQQTLVVEGLLDDGETSVLVQVPGGTNGFTAFVDVVALDAVGKVLGRGHGEFSGTGDACNFFSVTLGMSADAGADAAADARPDQAADELGLPADASGDRELLWDKSPSPDKAPQPDLKPSADVKSPPDTVPKADAACTVQSTINASAPSCNQQCVSASDDTDCDGLPNSRDPFPTMCNKLTLAEELTVNPQSFTTWSLPSGGSWTCGALDLAAGQELTLADLTPLAPARFLVEAELTLGAIVDPNDWHIRIHSVPAPGSASYYCELWVHPTYQPTPGLHSGCKCAGTWTSGSNYPAGPGTTYFLQVYYTSSAEICRLLDASGALVATKSVSACTMDPQPTKALAVMTAGRGATVHHVRVFAVP